MKTVLITGATGFIGQCLVSKGKKQGYLVVAGIRMTSKTTWLKKNNIPFEILSLDNPDTLTKEIKFIISKYNSIDVVIHNAGLTQSSNTSDYNNVNYILTKNLIFALKESCKLMPRFIFTSSLAALGPGKPLSLNPITENTDPNPVTHYGRSKLISEQFIRNQQDLPWIIIRPTAVYGPGESNFFKIIKSVNLGFEIYIGSKEQMLSFIYVKDLADIFIKLCDHDVVNVVYNLSDGNNYSIREVNETLKSVLNKKTIPIVIPLIIVRIIAFFTELAGRITGKATIINRDKINELEQLNWSCDSSLIINVTGFSPQYNFEKGIKESINWYKENGWL